MRLNWSEVEIAMANAKLTRNAVAERMGVTGPALNDLRRRADEGAEFQPATVGRLAEALGVGVREIILPDPPEPKREAC